MLNRIAGLLFVLATMWAAYVVVHRPPELRAPVAPVVVIAPAPVAPPITVPLPPVAVAPHNYQEWMEAHEPKEAAPDAPAPRKHVKAKLKPKAKPSRVDVQPTSGGHAVGVPCGRLKAGLDKWGYSLVVAGAPAYGYSATDVDNAMKACGLSK